MSRALRRRSKRGEDPVARFREQSRWSSFTNSWSFFRPTGWNWPLRGHQLLAVLVVGAAVGAGIWVLITVVGLFLD
jgi:hypothetical protein